MLGKVMKYEARACGRLLLPVYGLSIVLVGLLRLVLVIVPKISEPVGMIVTGVVSFMGTVVLIALAFVGVVYCVVRFYQGMFTSEAYLSFTLPVSVDAHLGGRLLVHSGFSILGMVVALLDAFILVPGLVGKFMDQPVVSMGNMNETVTVRVSDIPGDIAAAILGFVVVTMVLGAFTNIVAFYASFAIGTQIIPNPVAGGIIGYGIINVVSSVLTLPVVLIPMFNFFGFTNDTFIQRMEALNPSDPFIFMRGLFADMAPMLIITFSLAVVFAVVEYLISRQLMTKRLNLE